jgi:methyl-accepting chemotaxis protein
LTRQALLAAERVILARDVLAELDTAQNALDIYEEAFEAYDGLVQDQQVTREEMRAAAREASTIAETIEEGVQNYIANLKQTSDRLNYSITVLSVLVSVGIAFVITRSITGPIAQSVSIINSVSEYDLTQRVPEKLLARKDEVGTLTQAIDRIGENLRGIITNISTSSQVLLSSAQELASTSHQASDASAEVSTAISEIAEGATEQAKSTEDGVWNVNEHGKLIESDQVHVENLNESTDDVMKLKEEGFEILHSLVDETKKSSQASQTVYDIVNETNTSAGKIENASQMIQNIADQTNLLALNAAIEAARAGEAGKGFAVVAEEIRTLAEQSTAFTGEISVAIGELMDKASTAVSTMDEAIALIESQAKSVDQTSEKFDGIAASMENMKRIIDEINQSSREMEAKKVQIVGVMENLSSISEENAAGTEEAAASVVQQTTSIDHISQASGELSRLAEDLQEVITKFKL